MRLTRRQVLYTSLFGAGSFGLRALATGLPISFLSRPLRADSDPLAQRADEVQAQYLIVSASSAGDPVNANTPGTYDFADIAHSADPAMTPATFSLAGRMVTAALPWSTLPQKVLDRTCFFHHATLTNNHPNLPKVMRMMGATVHKEMIPSICSKYLASSLGTLQSEPLVVGAGEVLTYEGRGLPNLNATDLRDALAHDQTPLGNLHKLRDDSLDKIQALLNKSGTAAQKRYLDSVALSHSQARSISHQLLSNLAAIQSDGPDGQVVAAATLIKMNVSPVVAIAIPFGGDNHFDQDLKTESAQTQSGVRHIADLMAKLQEYGLSDRVTFAMLNVFGRTLKRLGTNGRDHWACHHTTVIIGKPFRGGVIGGLTPSGGDYYALPIDSQSGKGDAGADIPFSETLSAMGKTLARGLGVPKVLLDQNISLGKVVRGALA